MKSFLLKRFATSLLTILAATIVVFGLSRLVGDPRLLYAKPEGYGITPEQYEALGKKLNLDKPLVVQYGIWLSKAVRGDLGVTLFSEKPVFTEILDKLPNTLQLAAASWLFATAVGIPLGVMSAVYRGSLWDYLGRGMALVGQALPQFWVGIMGILVFAVFLGWLPSATKGNPGDGLVTQSKYFVLPVIVLGWSAAAGYVRLTRSAMLEVWYSEYVKLARAKGVTEKKIIWKHAFRNALIPPITLSGLLMANFLNGAVIIEAVFAWPGLGGLAAQSVFNNDFPLLTGVVLIFAVIFVMTSFLADVAYAYTDPRIRY